MRFVVFAAALILSIASQALALEIEERRTFGPEGGTTLRILSTADADVFESIVRGFLQTRPEVRIDYVVASSAELNKALLNREAGFDIAVSSAMDLQTKLANDGFARAHESDVTKALPDWARWRDHVFAFTQEPATIVLSRAGFKGFEMPKTRQDLITILRNNPDHFRGRVGTYDVRTSGLGYLFATQDARSSEIYWRLSEVMGGLSAKLYCCSSRMIDDVMSGEIYVAYNVLGSYAQARATQLDGIEIIEPRDFTTLMLRTALIPLGAEQPELAGEFIDYLVAADWATGDEIASPFPAVQLGTLSGENAARPIRMGPGLLVYLDRLKRAAFLRAWESAILQGG